MHRRTAQSAGQIIGQMSGLQVIGLDIAKNVFQLHTVDMSTGEIVNVQLKRAKVFRALRQSCALPDRYRSLRRSTPLGPCVDGAGPCRAANSCQGCAPVRERQQDRRHGRTRHLAGDPTAGHQICGREDARATCHAHLASSARDVDADEDHADQCAAGGCSMSLGPPSGEARRRCWASRSSRWRRLPTAFHGMSPTACASGPSASRN